LTLASKNEFKSTGVIMLTQEIIRPKELPQKTGLSRTTCWRLERAGDFPKRIRLSAGAVGYRRAEVEQWLADRQAVGGN
jgi:prophage regulatory protein